MEVLILFTMIVGLMLLGVPIAVSLGFSSIVFLLVLSDSSLASIAQTFFQAMAGHYTLLAIPFFILAGNLMAAGGISRRLVELIRGGALGEVKEAHVWTDRPIWPQGIDRPKDTPRVPETLDWNLWLGPAPQRPYHPAYVPFKWRGWWDFGCGRHSHPFVVCTL